MNYDIVESLITANRGITVDFGTKENAPSAEWIERAEARLGKGLPESYKWFLLNYGGGEINGNEVFSIYQMEAVVGGDLVYQYSTLLRHGMIEDHEIPIMSTDFGEDFVFDASVAQTGNEYPVYIKRGGHKQLFADNFIDFLCKVIKQDFEN